MASTIFRKVALERLSSPEQLDQTQALTPARNWIALLAVLLLVGLTVVWGFQGAISTTAPGQGVIVRSGGVLTIAGAGSGVVTSMTIKVGDRLTKGQVIARIAQPALTERVRATQESITELERQRAVGKEIRSESVKLQSDMIVRQRENALREIRVLQDQAKIVAERIPVEAELLAKGLITRRQTFEAKQRLVDIEGQVASLGAQLKQLDSQQYAAESGQFQADVEILSRISDMKRTLSLFQRELEFSSNVVSPYAGEVIELKVVAGNLVIAGAPLLSMQPEEQQLEVLVYVPAAKSKQIAPGMDAQISPTTVRREEYGFLRGRVLSVADYPATPAALMRNFQNESLVTSLSREGPVTELRVALEPDPATKSGYRWSSPLGPPVTLSSGTLCSAQVVTRLQKPVTLVIPFFKEKLGVI